MENTVSPKSHWILFLNTAAFTVCFAVWMFNGVLVTFLVDKGIFKWGPVEIGWLLGVPVLTGSLFRLPLGILTDKFGGKWVFGLLLLFCAIPMYLLSYANSFWSFVWLSFGYGLAGTGFAVGIAFTSVWYPRQWQGTALGIFGVGNAGAAITTLVAPTLLNKMTRYGEDLEKWRVLPKIYAVALVVMAVIFFIFSINKKPQTKAKTIAQMFASLKNVRVWRFGSYYFLVFGCFVALSQWLVPYFVNVYSVSLVTAGLLTSLFSLPSGVIRALGGWMSDKWGARKVMFWVLSLSTVISLALVFPKMELFSPGKGVMAIQDGTVSFVSADLIRVDSKEYALKKKQGQSQQDLMRVFPAKEFWQTPVVSVGERVKKKQILARGTTSIAFDAHLWIYSFLTMLIGIVWGIGKAGVYKYIPEYFPEEVGTVGGMVGVIGGLAGFICPIIFGYLLEWTGLWTSCWMFLFGVSVLCLAWLQRTINLLTQRSAPQIARDVE